MKEKLYKKLEQELKDFKEMIKEKDIDYAIDKAYELTSKQEIIHSLQFDSSLSKTQIKALLAREDVLDELYADWIKFDGNMREDINCSIDKSLNFITNSYIKNQKKINKDVR